MAFAASSPPSANAPTPPPPPPPTPRPQSTKTTRTFWRKGVRTVATMALLCGLLIASGALFWFAYKINTAIPIDQPPSPAKASQPTSPADSVAVDIDTVDTINKTLQTLTTDNVLLQERYHTLEQRLTRLEQHVQAQAQARLAESVPAFDIDRVVASAPNPTNIVKALMYQDLDQQIVLTGITQAELKSAIDYIGDNVPASVLTLSADRIASNAALIAMAQNALPIGLRALYRAKAAQAPNFWQRLLALLKAELTLQTSAPHALDGGAQALSPNGLINAVHSALVQHDLPRAAQLIKIIPPAGQAAFANFITAWHTQTTARTAVHKLHAQALHNALHNNTGADSAPAAPAAPAPLPE